MSYSDYIFAYNYAYYNSDINFDYNGFSVQNSTYAGILYILVSAIFIAIYSRILYIIKSDKNLWSLSVYKIMFHRGIGDILQLWMQIAGGIFSIAKADYAKGHWIVKLAGAAIMCGWFAIAPLALLLAINRFVQMIFPQYADRIFSRRNTHIFLTLAWLTTAPITILDLLPIAGYFYQPLWVNWDFNGRLSWEFFGILHYIVNYYIIVIEFINFALYAIILINLIKSKCSHGVALSTVELRITLQMAIICIFDTGACCYWLWAGIGFSFFWAVLSQMLWIIFTGINPIIYLLFNSTIRRRFFTFKNSAKINTVNIAMSTRQTSKMHITTLTTPHF